MYTTQLWVSKDYRDYIKSHYGLPDEERGAWNLLEYLLLNPIPLRVDHDEISEQIIIPHKYIQRLFCNPYKSAETLISEWMELTGIELSIYEYDVSAEICRSVTPHFDAEVLARTKAEIAIPYNKRVDKVVFATGETYTGYKERRYREQLLDEITSSRLPETHPAYELVEYLHGKRVQKALQRQLNIYGTEAFAAINAIEDEEKRDYALKVHKAMQRVGYIQYKDAEHTSRIFSAGANMLCLPREVRYIYMRDTYNIDLKFAQLAIVCTIWNVPATKAFVCAGGNIWDSMSSYIGKETSEVKDNLKTILYGLFYGMSKRHIKQHMVEFFGNDHLFDHPLLQELLAERDRQRVLIRENKGGYDAFGRRLTIERERYKYMAANEYVEWTESNIRSVLCAIVQSYELALMLGVFEAIKSNPDLLLIAWLHDGVYVKCINHSDRIERYSQQIADALNSTAKKFKITVSFTFDLMSPDMDN
jgi:hypothetical protein